MAESPPGGASDPSREEQSARSCRSMVVRAAQGEPETRARRTLNLSARTRRWHPRQHVRAREQRSSSEPPAPHPLGAGNPRGQAGATGLTWQCSGLHVWGILVHRHGAATTATGKKLPRRGKLAGHRQGEHRPALGGGSGGTPPSPAMRPHLPVQLSRLAEGPTAQFQHPVRTDAVKGPASRRGAPASLHPAFGSLRLESPAPTVRRQWPGLG